MTVKNVKRVFRWSNLALVLLVGIVLALNCYYVVEEREQAVVITLGTPSVVTSPGIHLRVPFVQQVRLVSTAARDLRIGYVDDQTSITAESLMITSDFNFVNIDFYIEYQVSNPERYLFATAAPEEILRNMALSYIRDTIGLHTVDEVITTGKGEIQAEIRSKLAARLIEEDIGLELLNITIQDSEPPTAAVQDAFKNVETAMQGKETRINEARQYENTQLPAARAQVDATLREAETTREVRINEAKAQVAVFNAMYNEYIKNPDMTRQRMFYETMEEVLPYLKIIIDNGDGQTQRLLPLEPFSPTGAAAAQEE